MRYQILIVIGLLLPLNYLIPLGSQTSDFPLFLEYSPEQNFAISFIDYDESLINTSELDSELPHELANYLNYELNYEYSFSNSSFAKDFNDYVDTIASADWTSKLNETALIEQRSDFSRKKIFTKQQGTAIDAISLENYLSNNLPSTQLNNNNLFHIFVLNLSRLDDSQNDHWLNVTEIDPDALKQRFNWRLEWDDPLNFDVKFPFAAFSQQSNIAIIDPTAFQWYLTWRAIWNTNTLTSPSYLEDLDHLIANKSSMEKRQIVTDTLSVWLHDWIFFNFNMFVFDEVELGSSLSLQLAIVYNSTEIDRNRLTWIINQEYSRDIISDLLLSSNVDVDITFYDLNVEWRLKQLLLKNEVTYQSIQGASSPFENWKFFKGIPMYDELLFNDTINDHYFDLQRADKVLKGVIYVLNNSSFVGPQFTVPWTGGLFTGLGGNRQVTILYELNRALMPDNMTPKRGLNWVTLHEVGHAVGLPHPFSNRFTGDFISDVMGYYPGVSKFSKLVENAFHRAAVDQKILEIFSRYSIEVANDPKPELLNFVADSFESLKFFHQEKSYVEAYMGALDVIQVLISGELFTGLSSPTGTTSSSRITSDLTVEESSSTILIETSDNNSVFSINTLSLGVIFLIVVYLRRSIRLSTFILRKQ